MNKENARKNSFNVNRVNILLAFNLLSSSVLSDASYAHARNHATHIMHIVIRRVKFYFRFTNRGTVCYGLVNIQRISIHKEQNSS